MTISVAAHYLMGKGTLRHFAQLVGDGNGLGVPSAAIRYLQGDTDKVPFGREHTQRAVPCSAARPETRVRRAHRKRAVRWRRMYWKPRVISSFSWSISRSRHGQDTVDG